MIVNKTLANVNKSKRDHFFKTLTMRYEQPQSESQPGFPLFLNFFVLKFLATTLNKE